MDGGSAKFISDLSFAYIQWKFLEDLGPVQCTFKKVDIEKLIYLCLAIIPGCKTLLHVLANKSTELAFVFKAIPV